MFKFEAIGAKLAAIACTIVFSGTMILGAVGPAEAGSGFTWTTVAQQIA